eukprot:scaffold96162_cov47-Prasinocladus_malaysianus.AAC.1
MQPSRVTVRDPETLQGLMQILESRETVAKACDAVHNCLEANRCCGLPVTASYLCLGKWRAVH